MGLRRVAIVSTIFLASCASSHGTVIGSGDKLANVGGTISGIVRTSADTPLPGRKVTVVNVDTGEKLEASTAVNGGYTIKVPRGHYRIEVELRPGEALSAKPDDVHISTSDIDAGRNFVITAKSSPAG
jgi:carboxypeptidase family protein